MAQLTEKQREFVAANPFVAFTTIATETGDLVFEWTDQHGTVTREQVRLTVT